MKYLMFVLSFFLCFTACNTKAETIPTVVEETPPPSQPQPQPSSPAPVQRPVYGQRVLVNQEIVNWIKQLDDSNNEIDDIRKLIFYLDKEFTLEIDDLNYDPIVEIARDGMLVISAQKPPPLIRFSAHQQGKIESFTPALNETFIIGITVDGEPVSMNFKKNVRDDFFEIYAMEFPFGNYNIKSDNEFPKLYIYASIDDNIRNDYVHTGEFIAVPANPSRPARPSRQNTQTVPVQTVLAENTEIKGHENTNTTDHSRAENAALDENTALAENNETNNAEIAEETPENGKTAEPENKISENHKAETNGTSVAVQERKEEPASNTSNTPKQNVVTQPPQQQQPQPQPSTPSVSSTPSVRNTARSTNLIGQGTLTTDVIFNFIKSKPYTTVLTDSLVKELIDLYIEEARYEEINYDFAVAQMLYQTTMLSNRQFVRANNFGGLTPVRGEFDGTFPNRERGVRAHIHQLRGYAKGTVVRTPIMSPRWEMISNANRGNVRTFDQLYEKWSAYPRYREKIESLLKELYSFSDNSSSR